MMANAKTTGVSAMAANRTNGQITKRGSQKPSSLDSFLTATRSIDGGQIMMKTS